MAGSSGNNDVNEVYEFCSQCAKKIYTDEEVHYKNENGQFFCDQYCALDYNGVYEVE